MKENVERNPFYLEFTLFWCYARGFHLRVKFLSFSPFLTIHLDEVSWQLHRKPHDVTLTYPFAPVTVTSSGNCSEECGSACFSSSQAVSLRNQPCGLVWPITTIILVLPVAVFLCTVWALHWTSFVHYLTPSSCQRPMTGCCRVNIYS